MQVQSFVRGKYASVAAMLADAANLTIGEEVETISYHDGWAATVVGPQGGAIESGVTIATGFDLGQQMKLFTLLKNK